MFDYTVLCIVFRVFLLFFSTFHSLFLLSIPLSSFMACCNYNSNCRQLKNFMINFFLTKYYCMDVSEVFVLRNFHSTIATITSVMSLFSGCCVVIPCFYFSLMLFHIFFLSSALSLFLFICRFLSFIVL